MSFFMANSLYFLQIIQGSILDTAQSASVVDLINQLIAFAIILAGLLSFAFVFWGGIRFILSGGEDEKIKEAVSTIRFAIIGLIFTMASVIIVNVVGRVVGINTVKYLNVQQIIQTIDSITSDLQGDSKSNSSQDQFPQSLD